MLAHDTAINYAFQQNAIPIVKELRFQNDNIARKDVVIRVSTEPAFAAPAEVRIQAIDALGEFRVAPLDLKLSHDFLAGLNERVAGWLKVEVFEGETVVCERTEGVSLLARNEWCGLVSLPEIVTAFILPNDPAVMPILGRAAELLRESTGQASLNGYQDKNRQRAWEQVAAIYRAIAELAIRYINPPASFESTGQKIRFPGDVVAQRFGTCLDLALLVAACCEQAGLRPFVFMHEGHAYAGCWLEERSSAEPADDNLQQVRKLATDALVTVFETTMLTNERPGTLVDAEQAAHPHLTTNLPFRLALDVHRSRLARIHPLPIPGVAAAAMDAGAKEGVPVVSTGIGSRTFADTVVPELSGEAKAATRIDSWKSRLLDLSLRNRLLNFRETKSTIRILSAAPEHVEDELAAERELALRPKPRVMGEEDPRNASIYSDQQRKDALLDHLRDELGHGRLHTHLDQKEHARRLTDLFRAARNALDENGTNTLFAAVGFLEWRETEHSDRVHRAPLLLVPVQLKRKSVMEGFSLRRIDEETRLNVTLMEMLRQNFRKEISGLDPLSEDDNGVNVGRVFQIFREAVREMVGWEVKSEVWLGQFSFTKFLLWKDLTDRLDDLTRNRVVNHLVNEAGAPYPNPSDDVHPRELDDRFHPGEIFCPRSADSSQLAAVMAAAAGHDFVLEGPPGTGKSQTITNIIAHCLAEGKRVLFVAEKRAALDVVHRRLREDGLEPFCLELHSNKIGKADVLAQFDRSLKFVEEGEISDWKLRTEELERLRRTLNAYTQSLHRRVPSGLSAHRCLDYLLPRKDEATVRMDGWPQIAETTAEAAENARQLSRRLQERSASLMPLIDHALAPLGCTEWSPGWAEQTLELVRGLGESTQQAMAAVRSLQEWLRYPRDSVSLADLEYFEALAASLLSPEPVGPDFATTVWATQERDLKEWIAWIEEREQLRTTLRALHTEKPSGTRKVATESWSDAEVDSVLAEGQGLLDSINAARSAEQELREWVKAPAKTASRFELAGLVAVVNSLRQASPVAGPFVTTAWSTWVKDFDQWIEWVRERVELRSKLEGYDETQLLALELDKLREKWTAAQGAWFIPRWLRIGYVRRHLRTARPDKVRPDVSHIEEVVEQAIRLREINRLLLESGDRAESLLGSVWGSGEPETAALEISRTWGEELHDRLDTLADASTPWGESLRKLIAGLLDGGLASFAPASVVGKRLERFELTIATFDEAYESLAGAADMKREPLDEAEDHLGMVESCVVRLLRTAPRLRQLNAGMASAAGVAEDRLGLIWCKGEPDGDALRRTLEWGALLHERMLACAGEDLMWLGQLRQLLASLFTEGPAAYAAGTAIGDRFVSFRENWNGHQSALQVVATEIKLRREVVDRSPDYLTSVARLVERIVEVWPRQIREWCHWQKARSEAVELGLLPIVEARESEDGITIDLPTLFERSFRKALFFALIEQEPVLREFFGREHGERIERFRELDGTVATMARDLIRARLAGNIPTDRDMQDVPKAEIGLLRKEIGKRMRHIPVRQLIGRIPTLLSKLKPCVLMSPLSVAQYLEASHEAFDVVIFDEASQIPVWDAVGAIARGKQLIVVGDPKQLPPTNFFSSSAQDEDDVTPEEHKDLESILDELMTNGLRHKRLQWHYRSRHEGLITFSNRQYYENDLLTFPSPEAELGGVKFRHLPKARYDKGKSRTNKGEAEALVKELVARLRAEDGPRRSFGVVTFSQAQQQLVENLLDEERRKHPEIEAHFGDEPPVEGEPVFVKNLENVQGDERDVIFFSICYGLDENGKLSMNFGPLNRDGGERRLNVAVTRAKHEVVVFSGLKADQIDLTRTRALGVRDLKYFLDYADRGPKALSAMVSASGDAEVDSEFERLVADRIRAEGYDVHHQVGCSGYRIDLGIVDPKMPGRYLLGVECDGATYHRAATARDRDKLRQAVLEDLGWNLHRIWSTDWWHDADKEMSHLLQVVSNLLEAGTDELPQSEEEVSK